MAANQKHEVEDNRTTHACMPTTTTAVTTVLRVNAEINSSHALLLGVNVT